MADPAVPAALPDRPEAVVLAGAAVDSAVRAVPAMGERAAAPGTAPQQLHVPLHRPVVYQGVPVLAEGRAGVDPFLPAAGLSHGLRDRARPRHRTQRAADAHHPAVLDIVP